MKIIKSPSLDKYLDQLEDIHELNLSTSDLLSSIFGNLEITSKKEIELLSSRYHKSEKDVFISKITDYLDIDLDVEDNEEIFNKYIAGSISELDLSNYSSNPYYQLVKPKEIKYQGYEIKYDHYEPYELFAYQDMKEEGLIEINSLGYFKDRFDFITLNYKGVTWMNITPNEIETMKSSIDKVEGDVIVFGLGLGYFAFMASNKKEVNKVTIIENNPTIIKLFKDNLLDYFPHKEKITIKEDDAFNYLNKKLDYDYAFVDLWHNPSDGIKTYLRFKESEKKNKSTTYLYWLESSFYLLLRRCLMSVIIESRLGYTDKDYISKETVEDELINTYYQKTKNLVIFDKAQLDNLLSDKSLLDLLLN